MHSKSSFLKLSSKRDYSVFNKKRKQETNQRFEYPGSVNQLQTITVTWFYTPLASPCFPACSCFLRNGYLNLLMTPLFPAPLPSLHSGYTCSGSTLWIRTLDPALPLLLPSSLLDFSTDGFSNSLFSQCPNTSPSRTVTSMTHPSYVTLLYIATDWGWTSKKFHCSTAFLAPLNPKL